MIERNDAAFPPRTWADWLDLLERDRNALPLERLRRHTEDDLLVEPLYTADAPHRRAATPRKATSTRAFGQDWNVATELDDTSLDAVCAQIVEERDAHVDAFRVRLDLSQRIGRDADQRGRRAADGLEISSPDDVRALRSAVGDADLTIDAGGATPLVLAMAMEVGGEGAVRGGTDIVASLLNDGRTPGPLDSVAALYAELARTKGSPERLITLRGDRLHSAGATSAQELGGTLGLLVWHLRALERARLGPEEAFPRISVQLASGRDVFEQLAKFRALPILWQRVADLCGVDKTHVDLHAATSRRTPSTRDPWVNMLRTTAEVFSAAAGGARSISTWPFDRLLQVPSPFSRRVARNAQLVLRDEAYLGAVGDPAAGSWYIESLTEQLAESAWQAFQRIEEEGGAVVALGGGGPFREEIMERTDERRTRIEHAKMQITGVNAYPQLDVVAPPAPAGMKDERADERVQSWRKSNPPKAATKAFNASGGDGVESLFSAIRAGATLETLTSLIFHGSEPDETTPLIGVRDAEPFEALRARADRIAQHKGRRPRVFLANMGSVAEHKARAMFTASFFAAGGFDVVGDGAFDSVEAAAESLRESGTRLAVFCCTDSSREQWLEELVPALRDAGARAVLVAGKPGDEGSRWREAGVDGFIFAGGPMAPVLRHWLDELGGAA